MIPLVIDFETYYADDYGLKIQTTSEYIFDPRFEVIGVGIRYGDRRAWLEAHQFRAFALGLDWSKYGALAHHAHFDGLILSHHFNARPGYWLDTLSMARALYGTNVGGSLGALMERFGVGVKGDEVVKAKNKRRADFTQQEWEQYGVYCLNDCDGALGIFQKMCPAFPRSEYDIIDTTIRMFTEPVLVLDQQQMAQYLGEEMRRKQELLDEAGIDIKAARSGEKFANLLRAHDIEPPTKLNPKGKTIYAFAKTDPGMQELLEHEDDDIRLLAEVRVESKSTINVSRTARMMRLGENGRAMPVYLAYSGAHTWRWSGKDKVNWQNFEKVNEKNPKKGMIRKSIRAPEGYKIVKADASQIEARWNAWHNGQTDLVAMFARGEDIYSNFASDAYGRPIDRKHVAEDKLPGQVGKICILGLGYQMGWLKLAMELLMGRGGAPRIQFTRVDMERLNVDAGRFLANPRIVNQIKLMPSRLNETDRMVHCAVANHFVETYRRKMSAIAGGWEYWGGVIKWLFSGEYRGPVGNHGVLNLVDGGLLHNATGLMLKYPHLEWDEARGFTYLSDRNKRSKLYGGLVVENITQFCCHIVISEGMQKLTWGRRRTGLMPYKVAQTEHDALSLVVRNEEAGEALCDLMRELTTPPAWAPGLPLAVEGGIGQTMGDAK